MLMGKKEQGHTNELESGYKKAASLINQGEFAAARDELERLLKDRPQEAKLLTLMGNSYFESGEDLDKAEEFYREALEYKPDNVLALTNLAMLYIHQKRFDEGVEFARKAIQRYPRDPKSWITLGMYYVFKGQIETALGYLLAAYSHDNRFTIAAYNAGCALIELERYDEALYYLNEGLADGEFYRDALSDPSLDPIRDNEEFKRIMSESRKHSKKPPAN